MSWLRTDDLYPDHPKLACLPIAARWAHLRCMSYCARYLTDGFIPAETAREYAGEYLSLLTSPPPKPFENPLLGSCDGGFIVHDYLDYNPTRAKVLADKKRQNDRQSRFRNAVTDGVTNGKHSEAPSPSPGPVPKPVKTSTFSLKGIDESVLGYFIGKVGRDAKDADARSLRTLCKHFDPGVVTLAIGQAVVQGHAADDFAYVTAIAKAESE